jgi:MSHA pilin protein MshA
MDAVELCIKSHAIWTIREGNVKKRNQPGFTLIELVLVIVILGVLAAFALPRFADLSSSAKISTLRSVEGTMKSPIGIVKAKARAQGLSPAAANPGGSNQTGLVIETEAGRAEVDWRNLCPESRAESADALTMLDYLSIDETDSAFLTNVDNQFVQVGYDLSTCYVEYDSFGDPECTVTTVTTGC